MKLEIIRIIDRGDQKKERLYMKVTENTDLNFFIVFVSEYADEKREAVILNKNFHWFAPKAVKAGDFVILYTRAGNESQSKTASGGTNHFFFWGLDHPLWEKPLSAALLLEANFWQTSA